MQIGLIQPPTSDVHFYEALVEVAMATFRSAELFVECSENLLSESAIVGKYECGWRKECGCVLLDVRGGESLYTYHVSAI